MRLKKIFPKWEKFTLRGAFLLKEKDFGLARDDAAGMDEVSGLSVPKTLRRCMRDQL